MAILALMIGFTAEHESGEIIVDGTEIDDAAWYGMDNLPQKPSAASNGGKIDRVRHAQTPEQNEWKEVRT